jgi:CheY-like chemotaxis protein
MLESLGYEVIACTSSTEALEKFRSRPQAVDLVITDMTMPRMTGAGLAGKIRSVRPDLPIILCTGYSEIIDPSRIGAMGITELMMKPIRLQSFAETVRRALDGSGPAN